jgi:uncharacterized protein (TIGR03435 family)
MPTEARELLAVGIFGANSRLGDRIEVLLRRGRTFSPRASSGSIAASALLLAIATLTGSITPRWLAFAQEAARPSFDVASIKPVARDKRTGPGRLRYNPQGIDFSNVPLAWLVGEAYGVGYSRVSSPDKRINDMFFAPEGNGYFFDIAAKTDHNVPPAQIKLMLQSLLADRFALVAHREARVQPVYKLTAGRTGPKLDEGVTGEEPGCSFSPTGIVCRNVDMTRFSGMLSMVLDRPVLDSTGLAGAWNFTLKPHSDPAAPEGKAAMVDWFTSFIFSDIEKQLGLRLEADKGPVEYLVIDHAEQPNAN